MAFKLLLAMGIVALVAGTNTPSLESFKCAQRAFFNLENAFPNKLQDANVRSEVIEKLANHPDICKPDFDNTLVVKGRKNAECPQLPPANATSDVCNLKPCNIGAVGAIGDSVTVGCNADSGGLLSMRDYPGRSWSMGGDADAVTMPNILCNAEVRGKSMGSGSSKVMNLNHAVNGAVVQDMPGQTVKLIADLKNTLGDEYETTWKVVTVFIGGNNLCEVCVMSKQPQNDDIVYKSLLGSTIQMLTAEPRMFINVVKHLDYTQLVTYKKLVCRTFLPFVCECLTADSAEKREVAQEFIIKYNKAIDELVTEANHNITLTKRKDVTVVAQPFLVNTIIPDAKYISAADCFHPSGLGQDLFAVGLWNNMIQPEGAKNTSIVPETEVICATEQTLLQCHQS